MRLKTLLLTLTLASLACNAVLPDRTPPTPRHPPPITATVKLPATAAEPDPTPTATALAETTTEPGATEAGATPTTISAVETPEPPPAGVRACDYDPLVSTPAEMPQEVLLAATPTPLVVEQPANTPVDPATTERQVGVFNALAEVISTEYVYIDLESLNWPALREKYEALINAGLTDEDFYLAMDNMVHELGDEHSDFQDPQQVIEEEAKAAGTASYVGVGLLLQRVPGTERGVVILPYPGSSAAEAGIKTHDAVLAVDGQPIIGEDGRVMAELVRGPEGTEVTLTIQRPGEEPRDVTLVRRSISSSVPVDFCMVPRTRIGYILLSSLADNTIPDKVRAAVTALTASGPLDGLVLDNRQNGGGFGNVLEDVLAIFTGGTLGHFVSRDEQRPLEIEAAEIGNSQTVPLIVLVELGTASFGEIMSGVLQTSGRAQVVGQTTRGNVEILFGYDFDDGSRAWIARESFQPIGLDIGVWEESGIVPDVEVPTRWDLFTEATDPALAEAVEMLGRP